MDHIAKKMPDIKKVYFGSFITWRHSFFAGLVAFALAKKTKERKWKRRAARFHREIKRWHQAGNINCHHMVALFEAEKAVVCSAKQEKVKKKYDEAIAIASRYGLRQDCALANELAGEYFLIVHDSYWGQHYLSQSLKKYEEWGAHAKVTQLRKAHPDITFQ